MLPIDPFNRLLHRYGRGWMLAVIVTAIVLLAGQAHSQSPPASPTGTATPGVQINLPQIDRLFTTSSDPISRAVVRLDGRRLFTIAAPTRPAAETAPANRRPQQTRSNPIDLRLEVIENRLQRIAESKFDPDSLQVASEVDRSSGLPVLSVRYRVDGKARTEELLTVTTLDTEIHAVEAEPLASEWAQELRSALLRARAERRPDYLRRQAWAAAATLLGICLASAFLVQWQRRLTIRRQALATESRGEKQELSTLSPSSTDTAGTRTALLQHQLENRQERGINEIQRRLLQLGQLFSWGGGLLLILGLFPYSRRYQPIVLRIVQIPLKMLAIAFGTYLAIRFSGVLVDRLFLLLQDSTSMAPEASQRLALRFSTISRVGKSILAVLIVGLGMIIALSVIDVQVGPLLAGAGIIGVAISFASQSLIKDMINGFFILLEDQYGVGDVIIVGEVSGFVENMNLRITQLRNEEGRLITIPNSAITIVQNLSKEWSRVDLRIDVAYSADIDQALAVIEEIAHQMSRDRPWSELILEPPLLLGVDELDHAGATVRLWIKTQPLKQWEVAREYRRRLKLAFDRAGIHFGVPQQSLMLHSEDDDPKDSPATRIQGK